MRVRKASSQIVLVSGFLLVTFLVVPGVQSATGTQNEWAWVFVYFALAAIALVAIRFSAGPNRASLRDAITRTGSSGPVYVVMLAPAGSGAAVMAVAALRLGCTGVSVASAVGEDSNFPWDQILAVKTIRDGLGIKSRVILVMRGNREDFKFHLLANDGYAFANSSRTNAIVAEIEKRLDPDRASGGLG